MKRCPKCNRSVPDDNQKFCTFDGGLLVASDKPFDPNATIQSTANRAIPVEPPGAKPADNRQPDLSETIGINESILASAPTAVLPRTTGPTGSTTASNLTPATPSVSPPPTPPPPMQSVSEPATSGALPEAPMAAVAAPAASEAPVTSVPPPKKKSKLPLILGILALLMMFGAAALAAAAYFFVIKPRRQAMQPEQPIIATKNENENVNASASNATPEATPESEKTVSEFVAPPNTTKFVNSPANLDGKLAEHYLDLSFYYPDNWVADPKAGVPGASNFAKVERKLPDIMQESFAVGWYSSKGTFAADESTFPQLVEALGATLAKNFPGYRKVSEGPTKVNSLDGYEFRFVSGSKGEQGDTQLWGRVIFLPTGVTGEQTGATLLMLATSRAPELAGVEDVGEKGEMPVILESFRFGKGP